MLKLKAQDADDLQVVSAHMQDALIRVADINFAKGRRRFALVANRFVWEEANARERRRTGLHFENVTNAKRKGFANAGPGTVLSLMSITWKPGVEPSGEVLLTFAAGHEIVLEVEYLDAMVSDMGPAWSAGSTPAHEA